MEPWIIFLDIDGTLVPEGTKTVPESAKRALAAAKKEGHYLLINTGRCRANIDPYLEDLGMDGMILSCGQHILFEKRELLHHRLPSEACRAVIEAALVCRMDLVCESRERIACQEGEIKTKEAMAMTRSLASRFPFFRGNLQGAVFEKFVTWDRPDSDKAGFFKAVEPYVDRIIRSDTFTEFVPWGFSKATGMAFIMELLDIPKERTMAIGDSTNDLTMLAFTPHSVAMGNAYPESVKQAVEYVTTPIDRDGIAHAFMHYGLI